MNFDPKILNVQRFFYCNSSLFICANLCFHFLLNVSRRKISLLALRINLSSEKKEFFFLHLTYLQFNHFLTREFVQFLLVKQVNENEVCFCSALLLIHDVRRNKSNYMEKHSRMKL